MNQAVDAVWWHRCSLGADTLWAANCPVSSRQHSTQLSLQSGKNNQPSFRLLSVASQVNPGEKQSFFPRIQSCSSFYSTSSLTILLMKKLKIYSWTDVGQMPTKVKKLEPRGLSLPNAHANRKTVPSGETISRGNYRCVCAWVWHVAETWCNTREFEVIEDRWLNIHRVRGMTNTVIHQRWEIRAGTSVAHWTILATSVAHLWNEAETREWEDTVHCGRCHPGEGVAIKKKGMMTPRGGNGVHCREKMGVHCRETKEREIM